MPGPWEKYGAVQVSPNHPGSEFQAPQAAATLGNTQGQAQGKALDNRITAATMGDAIAKAAADRAKAQADAQAASANAANARREAAFRAAHNNLNQSDWGAASANFDQMAALGKQIASLRQQYNTNFKGKGIGSVLEYLPSTLRPANGVFDDTANSLLSDMAKAKGLTSQQFNTPAEQKMFFQPLIPRSDDTDEQIAHKIDQLQRLVNQGTTNYARTLGKRVQLAPTGPAAKQARVIDFNDLP